MTTKEILKELKATAFIVLGIGLFCLLTYLISHSGSSYLVGFFIYFTSTIILLILNTFIKNKYFNKIITFLSYPLAIIYALTSLIIPFGALISHIFFYFGIAFITPQLIYLLLKYLQVIEISNSPNIIYLKITLTVFICVVFNPILRKIVYNISTLRLKSSEKMKVYELEKQTDYILSSENIKFLVYSSYVIIIILMNYYNLQGISYNSSLDIDKAVLQSFVTFIAFDRAFILMKQLNFRPSIFLNKIIQSVYKSLKEDKKDENI